MFRQTIRIVALGLLLITILAAALIPSEFWPHAWVRHREYKGEFAGRPVVMIPPSIRRATIPLEYHINMTSGVCQIARIDHAGKLIPHSEMGSGYVLRDEIPSGVQLQLDPGSGNGRYIVRMGLKYHLLSPFLWRCLARGMLIGLIAVSLFLLFLRWRKSAWPMILSSLFTPLQWAVLIALAVLSCAILYPVLHESGHALSGLMLGGRIKELVLTSITGETPHVAFSYLPEGTGPWMNAGGVFLPILFAYVLLIVWFAFGRRLSVFRQALLLTPAVLLLIPGFVIDDHLRGMALQLGCASQGGILLVKTIPAWLAIAAYAMLGWRFWQQKRRMEMDSSYARG